MAVLFSDPAAHANADDTPLVLLMDNGSLRADPVFQLRTFAERLTRSSGIPVRPVSVLHSHKIDPAHLDDQPAETAARFLRKELTGGTARRFLVVPMFIGPSLALTEYLPEVFSKVSAETGTPLEYHIAAPLAGSTQQADPRLARILADHIEEAANKLGTPGQAKVAIVDHGTPLRSVNAIREDLAAQVRKLLGDRFPAVTGSSMERKPGDAFAFNDPLLEAIPQQPGFESGPLIVSMLFLLSGRHAGDGGDVADICEGILAEHPGMNPIVRTRLLGEHPLLLEILIDRLRDGLEALNAKPISSAV